MKPMSRISGITCSSAFAALVDVRMMLLSTERVLRRSLAPAPGTASSTCWVLVAACTVLMPAVIMCRVRSRSSSGRSMWARAVVVQEAPDTRTWRAGSKAYWLIPLISVIESSGSGTFFVLILKGELWSTALAPPRRWPRREPAGRIGGHGGVHEAAGGVDHHRDAVVPPGDVLGVARLAQDQDLLAVHAQQAGLLRRRPRRHGVRPVPCRYRCSGPYVLSLARYSASDASEVPTCRPVLTTKRSMSSSPRWFQSVSLPMRPRPLMPSVSRPCHLALDPLRRVL